MYNSVTIFENMVKENALPEPNMSYEDFQIWMYKKNPIHPDFVRVKGKVCRRDPIGLDYEPITEEADEFGRIIL